MLRHGCGIAVLLFSTLLFCEYFIHFRPYANPACHWPPLDPAPRKNERVHRRRPLLAAKPRTLRAVVIADLNIMGAKGAYIDRLRREWFMKRAFERALSKLRPEMVLVLGDMSQDGCNASDAEWDEVLRRFRKVTGRPSELALHVLPGDRDIGNHENANEVVIQRFANTFSARSPSSSSLFEWENISFVSLNAMTFLGDGCSRCLRAERVIETASRRLFGETGVSNGSNPRPNESLEEELMPDHSYTASVDSLDRKAADVDREEKQLAAWFPGPVVLLHLPLFRKDDNVCSAVDIPRCGPWHQVDGVCLDINSPADISAPRQESYKPGIDVLTQNASEYILHALRPRIVFSAHTHRYCERIHGNKTREITVPSFSWSNRDDPSFLLAAFHPNGSVTTQLCALPRESIVLGTYAIVGMVVILWLLCVAVGRCCCPRNEHQKQE